MTESVYLDNNATAPIRPETVRAVEAVMLSVGNPSSVHKHGRQAKKILEEARRNVAALCGAQPESLTFTSGGTEANNMVLRGSGRARILISAVEHPSVRDAYPQAEIIPVAQDGLIDLVALEEILSKDNTPALVSVMAANNETGIIQPVAQVSAIAHDHGALVHCDAVQAAGKIPLDVSELGADFLVVSAHKIGGPSGCGALVNVHDLPLEPLMLGGGQEKKVRSGTENLMGIAGFGAAAAAAMAQGTDEIARMRGFRDQMEQILLEKIPGLRIIGADTQRLGNTSCLVMPGVTSETQVMALDLDGFSVSAGSACSSGKVTTSPVLDAMGYSKEEAGSVIRVSFGWANEQHDGERFVDAFIALYERAGKKQSASTICGFLRSSSGAKPNWSDNSPTRME